MKGIGYNPSDTLTRYEQQQEEVADKVFVTAQAIWWYVIYAPEFANWSEDEARKFTLKMNDVQQEINGAKNLEFVDGRRPKEVFMEQFVEDSGINYSKLASEVPYAAKARMYGKKLPVSNKDKMVFVYQINEAVRQAMFLATYTLWDRYRLSKDEVLKYVDYFKTLSNEFRRDLNLEIIIKYFEEIERIPIIS